MSGRRQPPGDVPASVSTSCHHMNNPAKHRGMISQSGTECWTARAVLMLIVMLAAACGSSERTMLPAEADHPNVVAAFGEEVLTLEEFERQYARSTGSAGTAAGDSLAEYRDFLERYVNFRLKVAAATEAGIPDQPSVREELGSYRARLARPYLLDQEVIDPIVRQIYDRRRQLVDVSHVLFRVPPQVSDADTLEVYRRLQAVRDSIVRGADFGVLAARHSEDPSASGEPGAPGYRGRLGYFTGGSLVEPFETFAYTTPVGEVSPIFRTQFGYHFLNVHDRRPAVPQIRVSHIMVRPEPTTRDSARVRTLLEGLKSEIDEGGDFAELAREHSQDQQSAGQGGDIGFVAYAAQLPEAFREAAFAIEDVGDAAGPVETPFGFHLIRLTERAEPPTFEESYEELKALASRLPRTGAAEEELAREILAQPGVHVDTARVVDAFAGMSPDSAWSVLTAGSLPESVLADTFFVIGDTSFAIRHLADLDGRGLAASSVDTESFIRQVVGAFVTQKAIDLEALRLEDRDPDFRRLMQEFRDGLVLFEFMEDSVWARAEQDSAALRAYYDERSESYRWPERTRVISLQSASDSLLDDVVNRLDAGLGMAELSVSLTEDSTAGLRIDTTLIADSTYAVYDRALELREGERTAVLPHQGTYIVLMNDGKEPPRTKTFEEARSAVVSAYQEVVEERLIERLRRRYAARTFPERLVHAHRNEKVNSAGSSQSASP